MDSPSPLLCFDPLSAEGSDPRGDVNPRQRAWVVPALARCLVPVVQLKASRASHCSMVSGSLLRRLPAP